MEKMNRFLEIFWLLLGIISAIMAIYLVMIDGLEKNNKYMLMLPLLPFAMWIMRRSLRLRLEKNRQIPSKKK